MQFSWLSDSFNRLEVFCDDENLQWVADGMARCQECGVEVDLPFICSYCGGKYCGYHRLPENHTCPNAIMARSPSVSTKSGTPVAGYVKPTFLVRGMKIFGSVEVQHLLIAWLVIGFCFSVGAIFSPRFVDTFTVALLTVGLGFIGHELAHKFTAQRYGCLAEFRVWPWGLAMALVFALVSRGQFIFAAPGATYITPIASSFGLGYGISRKENGLISLAGSIVNIALATSFLFLIGFGGFLGLIGTQGYGVNLWLAAFNLLPFGPLDGQKVFSWNRLVWMGITIPLWAIIFLLPL